MSIEKLPSGKYRSVVRHAGAKRASEAVESAAEAKVLEATLKLSMGGSTAPRERHTVGEVVSTLVSRSLPIEFETAHHPHHHPAIPAGAN